MVAKSAAIGKNRNEGRAAREEFGTVTADTMTAVAEVIPGMPTSWSAFWDPGDDAAEFGDYGPAGNNFGRRTEFRCGEGQRCVLLKELFGQSQPHR